METVEAGKGLIGNNKDVYRSQCSKSQVQVCGNRTDSYRTAW